MWQSVLKGKLKNFHNNKDYFEQFNGLKTNQERVDVCIKYEDPLPISNLKAEYLSENTGKKAESSVKYRELGNKLYKEKNFEKAWTNYVLALMYAPFKSSQYFLALANQSALLYEVKLYQLCLNTISQIIDKSTSIQACLIEKLKQRASNCLSHLELTPESATNALSTEKNAKLHSSHTMYPHMSTKLDIQFSGSDGRYCVSNESVKAGDILFDEKPYCAILLPQFNLKYCDYCLKNLLANDEFVYLNIQTCDMCVNVLYCSTECRNNATAYHQFECPITDILYDLGIGHLAYRIVASTDFDILKKYFKTESKSLREYYEDFNRSNDTVYSSCDYDTVFNLVTNEQHTHVDDLYQYTLTAIFLGHLYTSLGTIPINVNQISALIVRHLLQTICNAHAITQITDCSTTADGSNVIFMEQERYATAIYPTVSLMNHSCKPNVICSFVNDSNRILIRATRDIDANEPIWNCYGPHYLKMNDMERRVALDEQYHFKCNCDYCDTKSALIVDDNIFFVFKCFHCSSVCLKFGNCEKCDHVNRPDEYDRHIKTIKKEVHKPHDELEKTLNSMEKILFVDSPSQLESVLSKKKRKIFKNCIDYVDYSKSLDDKARLLCDKSEFKKASICLMKSIQLLRTVYAYDSGFQTDQIEIALELYKLAELLCKCEEFESALNMANEALRIASSTFNTDTNVFRNISLLKDNISKCI